MVIALSETTVLFLFFGLSALYAHFLVKRNTFIYSLLDVLCYISLVGKVIEVAQATNIDPFFLSLIIFPVLIGLHNVLVLKNTLFKKWKPESILFALGFFLILGMNVYIKHGNYTPSNRLIIENKAFRR